MALYTLSITTKQRRLRWLDYQKENHKCILSVLRWTASQIFISSNQMAWWQNYFRKIQNLMVKCDIKMWNYIHIFVNMKIKQKLAIQYCRIEIPSKLLNELYLCTHRLLLNHLCIFQLNLFLIFSFKLTIFLWFPANLFSTFETHLT